MPTESRWPSEPGVELDPGHVAVRMPVDRRRSVRRWWRSRSRREEAELGQRPVERGDVVALGEEEVVAVGVAEGLRRDASTRA